MASKQLNIYNSNKIFKSWLLWSVFLYSCLVFNFLEPFEINIQKFIPVYHLILCGHGVVAALLVLCLERYLQPFIEKRLKLWNLISSIGWYLNLVFFISVANWLYALFIHYTISGWHGIQVPVRSFDEIVPMFASIYFVWALICATSGLFFHSIKKDSIKTTKEKQNNKITLFSENQSDHFRIKQEDIICFKTCDNYLQLYYLNQDGQIQDRLIRSSMKRMMVQLDSKAFFRCHQSYLVNKSHIQGLNKIKNQNYLELSHLDFDVSIARDNVKHVKTLLAS